VLARLLGIRLLKLDLNVTLTPARVMGRARPGAGAHPWREQMERSRVDLAGQWRPRNTSPRRRVEPPGSPSTSPRPIGGGLAAATRFIDEGEATLAAVRKSRRARED
jgi:hypothetical protein